MIEFEQLWADACRAGPDYLPAWSPVVRHFGVAVLEEAAKVCEASAAELTKDAYIEDEPAAMEAEKLAAAIRALIDQKPPEAP